MEKSKQRVSCRNIVKECCVLPGFILHIFRCLVIPFPGPEDVTVCKTVACTTFAETGTENRRSACAAYVCLSL